MNVKLGLKKASSVLLLFLLSGSLYAKGEIHSFCKIDPSIYDETKTTFTCFNHTQFKTFEHDIPNSELPGTLATFEEKGMPIYDEVKFSFLFSLYMNNFTAEVGNIPARGCFMKAAFSTKELGLIRGKSDDELAHMYRGSKSLARRFSSSRSNLIKLATALKSAGVCSASIPKNNTGFPLGISNNTQLLKYFLCVSNSESTFGNDNRGPGGFGPWGAHKTVHTKKGAACAGMTNAFTSDGTQYMKDPALLARNASCTLKILEKSPNDYGPWGTKGGSFPGSNKHCTRDIVDKQYKFEELIGKDIATCPRTI